MRGVLWGVLCVGSDAGSAVEEYNVCGECCASFGECCGDPVESVDGSGVGKNLRLYLDVSRNEISVAHHFEKPFRIVSGK